MHLYSGMSTDFISESQRGSIAGKLADSFFHHFRYKPSENEVRSWQNSLTRMANVLQLGSMYDQGVIVEYKLPLSSKRLDVMVTGKGAGNIDGAVIVELKQWDKVELSPIDECVATFVGGNVRDVLHPSRQAFDYQQYIMDTHSAFSDGLIQIKSCGFLHNLHKDKAKAVLDPRFEQLLRQCPTFLLDDAGDGIVEYLQSSVGEGDGLKTLRTVTDGGFRPHKRLLDHVSKMIKNEPAFTLLDEQRVAFNHVRGLVRDGQARAEKSVVIVHGGPGTGKSLIALHLLGDLAGDNFVTMHATGSKAFTQTLKKQVGTRAGALFRYFNNFGQADRDGIDLLVCDEAHRIRKSSNNQYTKKADKSDRNQIDEILEAAKVSVFLIDDKQVVRPSEVGSSQLIRESASRFGIKVVEHTLEAQFRCNGSDSFIQWVANTLELERTPQVLWDMNGDFDFDIVDSPVELEAWIRNMYNTDFSARLVAGFCWPWSDPKNDGNLEDDVIVGEWLRPWNARDDAGRLAPGIPKSNFWATDPNGINQVGCVYTAQGFEFDYVGLIWGRDLVYRHGIGWVGQPEFSHDKVVKRGAKTNPEEFLKLVKQTYRVLLTRGLRGCYVYFDDVETRNFVMSRIER